ncbi:RNA polymerase sigma-70 factor, ECF subfamily [Streptomyces zhaozhouensis]|uniref:RNA polymerase sigma-70 factor, ECF subfamily n=1 Tax=Streptomyces zhaozhouensis TaxID=1300267 RepID=A0A286E7X5_9ACTN|nr:sigma-70 family RNA polymerase sigma factor [Streptomyces zhaozhouensis]SOD66979.1 RNA polymerase sigma-70 factor, ECF subfamily [Streptomyces zhaozhouensis]
MTSEARQGQGGTHAQAGFYRAHHSRLVGFLLRRTGDEREAEALAHQSWVAYLSNWDRYQRTYDDPVAPLYVIARRRLSDWYKTRGSCGEELPAEEELAKRVPLADWQSDMAQHVDTHVDLSRALARLPHRQREALHLRYVDDLARTQVAALMGISDDGVKKLLSNAIARLRTASGLAGYSRTVVPSSARTTRKEVRK